MKTNKFFISALALGVVALTTFNACSDDDEGTKLPPIGGYASADEVGSADLLAYWPLNGSGKESKSNTDASNSVNTTFSAGIKGDGATFNLGYLNYPKIAALNSGLTGSVTVSLWAKVANNTTNPTMFFQLTKPQSAVANEWNGGVNIMAETGRGNRPITADTLMVKGLFNINKPNGDSFGGDAVNAEQLSAEDIANGGVVVVNKTANQWMHVVYVYDGTTAINRLYVNGVKISNPQWEERNKVDGVNVGVPFKLDAESHPVIGAFGTNVIGTADGWQRPMVGQVDEIRVWKKVLVPSDINALYELEKAGR